MAQLSYLLDISMAMSAIGFLVPQSNEYKL